MAKISLYRFDIIAGADRVDGICMAKVMEASAGYTRCVKDLFEVFFNLPLLHGATIIRSKHESMFIAPKRPSLKSLFKLVDFLFLECLHDRAGRGDCPAFPILRRDKETVATVILPGQLLIDCNLTGLQIYAVPGKAQNFTQAQTCK